MARSPSVRGQPSMCHTPRPLFLPSVSKWSLHAFPFGYRVDLKQMGTVTHEPCEEKGKLA